MLALDADVAVVTNVELDHHATYRLAGRAARRRSAALLAGAPQAVLWDRPETSSPCAATLPTWPSTSRRRRSRRRLALRRGAGTTSRLRVPGATTRATPPRRSRPARWRAPTRRRRPPRSPTSPAPGGASRRSARRATGARVVDDYAHHPTEVAATIAAARTLGARGASWPSSSRTCTRAPQRLAREFGAALAGADVAGRARRLPGARARRGLPGRHAACSSPRRPPTPPRGRDGAVAARLRRRRAGAARPAARRRPVPRPGRRRRRSSSAAAWPRRDSALSSRSQARVPAWAADRFPALPSPGMLHGNG